MNPYKIEIELTEQQLAQIISQWLKIHKNDTSYRSPVWIALKTELGKSGHWKNKARFIPNKGQMNGKS